MITSFPYDDECSIIALKFAKTLMICGHNINIVFFYENGVYHANKFCIKNNNEINLLQAWCNFKKKYKINLHICTSSAYNKGIIDRKKASSIFIKEENLHSNFQLSSLGNLSQAILTCDRFMQF